MALVWDGMPCGLCGEPLDPSDCFVTTHFLDIEHPLSAYSDAALHWECFDAWPERLTFSEAYFSWWVATHEKSTWAGLVYRSKHVAVAVSLHPRPVARICVASRAAKVSVQLADWERLCSGGLRLTDLRAKEQAALDDVLPELCSNLPDGAAVMQRLDTAGLKDRRRDAQKAEKQRRKAMKRRERARRKELRAHQTVWKRARRTGLACPHCGHGSSIRPVNSYPTSRSYFICQSCSRSFEPPVG
jgi:hypothetical protein